jgi:hypothetical protein
VKLTTHLLLVSRSRKCVPIHPLTLRIDRAQKTQFYICSEPTAKKTTHVAPIVACRLTAVEMCLPLRDVAIAARIHRKQSLLRFVYRSKSVTVCSLTHYLQRTQKYQRGISIYIPIRHCPTVTTEIGRVAVSPSVVYPSYAWPDHFQILSQRRKLKALYSREEGSCSDAVIRRKLF